MKGALRICSCAVVSPVSANWLPVRHISQASASSTTPQSNCTTSHCALRTHAGRYGSSESNSTCSPRRDTSGSAPKITTTISSSVISSEPGMELDANLRPSTSKKVSAMIANSAIPDSSPHRRSRSLFIVGSVPSPPGKRKRHRVAPGAAFVPEPAQAAGLLRLLRDLGTEVREHLGRVLQALGLGLLDPALF